MNRGPSIKKLKKNMLPAEVLLKRKLFINLLYDKSETTILHKHKGMEIRNSQKLPLRRT
jgi:hypothetical protein